MNHFEHSTTIDNDQVGCRLDRYLIQQWSHFAGRAKQLSRSVAQQMVQKGSVAVNGSIQKPSYKLKAGDLVWMSVEPDSAACVMESIRTGKIEKISIKKESIIIFIVQHLFYGAECEH